MRLLHGRAGTLAQARLGEISMNASDIIDSLPRAFMETTGEARR
jgi:NAD(P)H-hydrate repair Nnr-like enzyme with NAD(P)H-hydrate dehydratase domain